jgi:hypothetical protein
MAAPGDAGILVVRDCICNIRTISPANIRRAAQEECVWLSIDPDLDNLVNTLQPAADQAAGSLAAWKL